jgi:hypothetical protein
MQISGSGAAIGFLADTLFRTFPLGTGIGALAKNLFNLDAGDMGRAYDPKRATRGDDVFDFGDLKGMASGLFGGLASLFADTPAEPAAKTTTQKAGATKGTTRTKKAGPTSNAEAKRRAQPRTDPEAEREAQSSTGINWGKVLTWGGIGLAGLSLLNNLPFFNNFSMPFYGAGLGMPDFFGGNQYPPSFAFGVQDPLAMMMPPWMRW